MPRKKNHALHPKKTSALRVELLEDRRLLSGFNFVPNLPLLTPPASVGLTAETTSQVPAPVDMGLHAAVSVNVPLAKITADPVSFLTQPDLGVGLALHVQQGPLQVTATVAAGPAITSETNVTAPLPEIVQFTTDTTLQAGANQVGVSLSAVTGNPSTQGDKGIDVAIGVQAGTSTTPGGGVVATVSGHVATGGQTDGNGGGTTVRRNLGNNGSQVGVSGIVTLGGGNAPGNGSPGSSSTSAGPTVIQAVRGQADSGITLSSIASTSQASGISAVTSSPEPLLDMSPLVLNVPDFVQNSGAGTDDRAELPAQLAGAPGTAPEVLRLRPLATSGTVEDDTPELQGAGLVVDLAPAGSGMVELGVRQLLDQAAVFGGELAGWLAGTGLWSWFVAAALAAAACEITRRQLRKSQTDLVAAAAGEETLWTWWFSSWADSSSLDNA